MKIGIKKVLLISLFFGSVIFLFGVFSDLSLGDETYQYRLATYIYKLGGIPKFDPLSHTTHLARNYYTSYSIWHLTLVILWKLFGSISIIIAQFHQAIYYIVLILGTYLLCKEVYPDIKDSAAYSALIIATIPVVAALSIILHIDIPVATVSVLCFLMLVKKRYIWTGLFLALMVLTKRNGVLLIPAVFAVFLYYYPADKFIKRIGKLLILILIPYLIIIIPDAYKRIKDFGVISLSSGFGTGPTYTGSEEFLKRQKEKQGRLLSGGNEVTVPQDDNDTKQQNKKAAKKSSVFYDEGNIFYDPLSTIKYLGVALILLLSLNLALLIFKRKWIILYILITVIASNLIIKMLQFNWIYKILHKIPLDYRYTASIVSCIVILTIALFYLHSKGYKSKGLFIWVPYLSYMYLYPFVFFSFSGGGIVIRYLSPVFPFMAIIAGRELALVKNKYFKRFLIGLCILQFAFAALYTFIKRQMPYDVIEGFNYIKDNPPHHSRTLYCDNNLALYTGKSQIWYNYQTFADTVYLFWQADDEEIKEMMKFYGINYIMIKKDRIYDDSVVRHLGGYPASFINKFPRLTFLDKVLENKAIVLWKVKG